MNSKHIHKFKKRKYKSGESMFFCCLPDCYFKIDSEMVVGKESLCNICDEPFIMNEVLAKLDKPHCHGCGRRRIRDSEGKLRFVRIKRGSEILSAIAEDEVFSLREKLDSLNDEDI